MDQHRLSISRTKASTKAMPSSIAGKHPSVMLSQGMASRGDIMEENAREALIVLGCPEVPVQQALALYAADRLNDDGYTLTIAGNPAVLNLLRISDPKRMYIRELVELERCIDELSREVRQADLVLAFIHNDAGISFASTIRFLFPGSLIVLVFGREAEALAGELEISCELIMDPAVHNPGKLRRKLDLVMGW